MNRREFLRTVMGAAIGVGVVASAKSQGITSDTVLVHDPHRAIDSLLARYNAQAESARRMQDELRLQWQKAHEVYMGHWDIQAYEVQGPVYKLKLL